jgi:hypothetical protein
METGLGIDAMGKVSFEKRQPSRVTTARWICFVEKVTFCLKKTNGLVKEMCAKHVLFDESSELPYVSIVRI